MHFGRQTFLRRRFQILKTAHCEKMRLLKILPLLLIVLGAVILFERPAYAYADPGTGLLAIQAAGSALVASGWYLRRKIYALFNNGGAAGRGPEAAPGASEGEDSPKS